MWSPFSILGDILVGQSSRALKVEPPRRVKSASPFRPGRFKVLGPSNEPPHEPGGYMITKGGRKMYIGMAPTDVRRRTRQQVSGPLFTNGCRMEFNVVKPGATEDDLRAWEQRKIRKHRPPRNRHSGGNGRGRSS